MFGKPVVLPVHCQFCHREITILYRPYDEAPTLIDLTCPWKDCRRHAPSGHRIAGVLLGWWAGHGPRPLAIWTPEKIGISTADDDPVACPLWNIRKGAHRLRCTIAAHAEGWIIRLAYGNGEPYRALICRSEDDALDTATLWHAEAIRNGWTRET